MATEVHRLSMGRVQVTTIDRYDNRRHYEFRPEGPHGTLTPTGDGRKYTPVVLQAMWEEGLVVDWDPDELTADERAKLDGFCDDCGTAIRQQQVGPSTWENHCDGCGEVKETVEA